MDDNLGGLTMNINIPIDCVALAYDDVTGNYVVRVNTLECIDDILRQCRDIKKSIEDAEK
jgi:hypothetical protein